MGDDSTSTGTTAVTTDHGTIRDRIEDRGSVPARALEPSDAAGSLTVVPEGETDAVEVIPWEEFFETFENEGLAFVYRTEYDGDEWYCEFVDREGIDERAPTATSRESEPIESEVETDEPAQPPSGEAGSEPRDADVEAGEPKPTGTDADANATGVTSLTGDDEGKDVIGEDGSRLGTVAEVSRDAVRVRPAPDLSDERRTEFGLTGDREPYSLDPDRVEDVTATAITIVRP